MEKLSSRKEIILRHIIELYINQPDPVSSKKVLNIGDLSCSSATVRNEMNDLEQLGFITHPHTSAGRIPTDKGYRYYVDHLLDQNPIDLQKIESLIQLGEDQIENIDEYLKHIAKIVSGLTKQTGIVILPSFENMYFRYVNLIPLTEKKLLVVWSSMSGVLKEQTIELDEPIGQETLLKLTYFMNQECVGKPFQSLKGHLQDKLRSLKDSYYHICNTGLKILNHHLMNLQKRKVCVEGLNYLFDYPEFQQTAVIKPIFDILEKEEALIGLFEEQKELEEVVFIGKENKIDSLSECSVIQKSFLIRDNISGTLSVIGPKRMHYEKIIKTLYGLSAGFSESFQLKWYK